MIVLGGGLVMDWGGSGKGKEEGVFNGHTIAGFVKAVGGIAVGGEDYDGVA